MELNKDLKTSEIEEEILNFDKMYFLNYSKYARTMGKVTLFAIIGVVFGNVMMQNVVWWGKALFGLAVLFLAMLVYYDVKYIIGLKKNPFMIYPEKKILRYYNEFEGNKEIDITRIQEIKVYSRPNEAYLLEMFLENQEKEENVNVVGYDTPTVDEIMQDILSINSEINVTTKMTKQKPERKKK